MAFDDFDVVCVFELLGEAVADVAAVSNHDAAGAGFFGAQFGYDRPDVFGGGGKQDFVAFDDDGLRRGDDEAVVAVNGADLAVSTVGQILGDVGNAASDKQPAAPRLYDDHPHAVVCKT